MGEDQCHFNKIPPPFELVMLTGCLFGSRHDWLVGKYAVLQTLAMKHKPIKPGKSLPRGLAAFAARELERQGGLLRDSRPLDEAKGSERHDYRATIKGWLKDPLFCYLWSIFHEQYQSVDSDLLSLVENTLKSKRAST